MNYASEYHSCPLHGYRIKDERGCWVCLSELHDKSKHREKQEATRAKRLTQGKIKKVSDQQAKINREYAKTCQKIDQERLLYCRGCGKPQGGEIVLSHSHLISRDYCRDYNRLDLYSEERNITLHCVDWGNHTGCHSLWESNAHRHTLLDYQQNMAYIKSEIPDLCRVMLMNQLKQAS